MERYRYTPRGTTWKPCPGCGNEPKTTYKIGSVCAECARLLDWAKAEHKRHEHLRDVEIRLVPEANRMKLPYCPSSSRRSEATRQQYDTARDQLGEAIHGILAVLLDATGAAAEIYKAIVQNRRRDIQIIYGATVPHGADSPFPSDHRSVLLRSEHAKAFDSLGPVLEIMIQAAYAAGVLDGKDLLVQLSSGQITNDQFNDVDIKLAQRVQDVVTRAERVNERRG